MSVIHHHKSQTLLEAILAIGVILVSVFASTTLIVTTVTVGQSSEDKIVAGNLAREGIEIVRGIRDSNWMKRAQNVAPGGVLVSWKDNLIDGNHLAVYSSASGWSLPSGSGGAVSESGNSFLTQNCTVTPCNSTKFSRTISIQSNNETPTGFPGMITYLLVTSTVTWQNHGDKSLILTERLYDWR